MSAESSGDQSEVADISGDSLLGDGDDRDPESTDDEFVAAFLWAFVLCSGCEL